MEERDGEASVGEGERGAQRVKARIGMNTANAAIGRDRIDSRRFTAVPDAVVAHRRHRRCFSEKPHRPLALLGAEEGRGESRLERSRGGLGREASSQLRIERVKDDQTARRRWWGCVCAAILFFLGGGSLLFVRTQERVSIGVCACVCVCLCVFACLHRFSTSDMVSLHRWSVSASARSGSCSVNPRGKERAKREHDDDEATTTKKKRSNHRTSQPRGRAK